MPRIQPIYPKQASGRSVELLSQVEQKLGMVPNLLSTLAHSPAALQAYLGFSEALDDSSLSPQLREQIALTVSEANGCGYCVAAHCAIGTATGLTDTDLTDARRAGSPESKVEAALQFARRIVDKKGQISDDDLHRVRRAGYGDAEITEIIAVVAGMIFTNYFNLIADTEIDFPQVPELVGV